ncbi:hypothetical protein ACTZQ0_16105, partial [Oceanimonas smirnovii]
MTDKNTTQSAPELGQSHQAGDCTTFAGGQVSYLAPMPLPTGEPGQDYAHAVGEINDTYLTFGVGLPQVFGWQLSLGLTFTGGILIIMFLIPIFFFFIGVLAGFDISVVMEKILLLFGATSVVGL